MQARSRGVALGDQHHAGRRGADMEKMARLRHPSGPKVLVATVSLSRVDELEAMDSAGGVHHGDDDGTFRRVPHPMATDPLFLQVRRVALLFAALPCSLGTQRGLGRLTPAACFRGLHIGGDAGLERSTLVGAHGAALEIYFLSIGLGSAPDTE